MRITQEAAMKYVKALAGVLTLIGITVSPENQAAIAAGFMALYSIVTAIQAWIKQKQNK
jgi:hypothetical protein